MMRDEFDIFDKVIQKHPQLRSDHSFYEMTRIEKITFYWDRLKTVMADPELRTHILSHANKRKFFGWYGCFAGTNPMGLHMLMFTKALRDLGSEEQKRIYLPLANHWQIIGCYAQTELGHGSNVAGLETTATLDLDTDEFVIHTPSIKAVKFWPGNLGIQATHALVFARCIALETDYGVQPFLVPIRDIETFTPLPGIEVGDIGTKLGYNSVDNGYLKFNQVRIPRKSLLSRFVSITKTGDFKMKANPRIIYQIMVQTRITIVNGSAYFLHSASKIAIRYAACRRQFATIKGSEEERPLLDYQLHMDTLAKHLCISLVIHLTTYDLINLEVQSTKEVQNGNFHLLDILHHLSAGLKALCSELGYVGLDELRQACGGAGWLSSSGIADKWAEHGPFPTFEGVNVIMYQQSSRMLFKQVAKVMKGKNPDDFFAYLGNSDLLSGTKSQATTVAEFLEPDHIQKAMAVRAAYYVHKTCKKVNESKAGGKAKQNDLFALDINKMTRLHLLYIMYERARSNLKAKNLQCQNLNKILEIVLANYALKQLSLDNRELYECGFFGPGSAELLDQAYKQTLTDLRPQMVPLAELIPDFDEPSTIGNYYGDIYESQFETAQNSRLNTGTVPDLIFTHVKPTMALNPAPKL